MRTARIGALLTVTLALLAACGSSGGGGSQAAFCNTIKKANADPSLKGGANTKTQQAKVQKIYNELAANAPSSISADMNTLKDAYAKYAKDPAAFAKDTAATKKVQTASTHLTTYEKDTCKITPTTG